MSHRSINNAKRQAAKMSKNVASVSGAKASGKFFNDGEKSRKNVEKLLAEYYRKH